MFALVLYRSWLCPLHGGPLADCTSHDDTGPEFTVSRIRCRAEDARLAAQDEAKNTDRPAAVLWSVSKAEK